MADSPSIDAVRDLSGPGQVQCEREVEGRAADLRLRKSGHVVAARRVPALLQGLPTQQHDRRQNQQGDVGASELPVADLVVLKSRLRSSLADVRLRCVSQHSDHGQPPSTRRGPQD